VEHKYSRAERRQLPTVDSPDDAAKVIKALVCDEHVVGQLLVGLDDLGQVCGAAFTCPCDACRDIVRSDAKALVAVADRMGAAELVLSTFVEPERVAPTAADVARFEGLRVECRAHGIELLDHILMSGHRWRSVREVSSLSDPDLNEPDGDPDASTTW
jgi:hypothetical protein